jgi:hypothetical protein
MEKEATESENIFLQDKKVKLPKIGEYRMRAHINIFSDTPFP